MSLFAYLQGVNLGQTAIRMRGGGFPGPQMTSAADGSGSQAGIIFDDPTGSFTVTGWQTFTMDEPDCANRRLFTGLVADRTYRRGPYRTGAGREIDTTMNDQNAYLWLRLITGGDAVRPAETDAERVAWLLGSDYLDGLVYDTGWVNPVGLPFDAVNYHGVYPGDVLNDLCGPRGQIFFAAYDHTAKKVGLFLDAPTATTNTSSLTISNVLSDVDNSTCFAPFIDGELVSDPSEVYSNIRYAYKGGVIYENNTTTQAAFFPSPLLRRGLNVENDRVGKATTARTFAQRILARDADERIAITCTLLLPSTKVGLIDAGQRISVRFSHLPGFTSFAYTRVERKNILQAEGNPGWYEVTLTLSTHGLTNSGSGTGGGSTDPFPPSGGVTPGSLVQAKGDDSGTVILDATPTDGDLMVIFAVKQGGTDPTTPTGFTKVASCWSTDNFAAPGTHSNSGALFTKTASSETGTYVTGASTALFVMEWGGSSFGAVQSVNAADAQAFTAGGAITPAAANAIVVGCGAIGTFITHAVTPAAGVTEAYDSLITTGVNPRNWVGYKTLTTAAATTISGTLEDPLSQGRFEWGGLTFTLLPTATAGDPPVSGQPIEDETPTPDPDGVTTVFTAAYPFASKTLHVMMNGAELDADVDFTETDNTAGTFTFTHAPPTDAQIVIWYLGS